MKLLVLVIALSIQILNAGAQTQSTAGTALVQPTMTLTINGNNLKFTLTGTKGNYVLVESDGTKFPLTLQTVNGQQGYVTTVDGVNTMITVDQINQLTQPQPAPPSPQPQQELISMSQVHHPLQEQTYPNGQVIYYGWYKGKYRGLPQSLQLSINSGAPTTYTIGGTAPNGVYLESPTGQKYPLKPTEVNGEIIWIVTIGGVNYDVPFGPDAPVMPSPPVKCPSPQNDLIFGEP